MRQTARFFLGKRIFFSKTFLKQKFSNPFSVQAQLSTHGE